MWRRAGGFGLLTALVAVIVLVWGAPAWADPELRPSPASGPAGSEVNITGTGFAEADVEIHWGSQSGPLLGTARGPEFSVTVVIPDSPPNSYSLVAVVTDGNTVRTSNASFQLTPATEPVVTGPVETTTTTTSPPEREPATTPARTPTSVETRGAGVTGGLDPSLPDTVDRVPDSPRAVSGPTPGADAARAAADAVAAANAAAVGATGTAPDGAATSTSPAAGRPPGDVGPSSDPPTEEAGTTGGRRRDPDRAYGATSPSQSSGAVQSPALLFAGLGMIMAGAAFLALRKRRRLGP